MRSPHFFIVKPVNGRRYDNIKKFGEFEFITSSSKEDHKAANRYAEVLSTPIGYSGKVTPGSIVIVHHNVFKYYNDMQGNERSGRSFLKDDLFMIDEDQFYLYDDGNGWKAHSRYCFVKPVKAEDDYIMGKTSKYEYLVGEMVYPNDHLVLMGVNKGDIVGFTPESEYEVFVDGQLMYRMYSKDITIKFDEHYRSKE